MGMLQVNPMRPAQVIALSSFRYSTRDCRPFLLEEPMLERNAPATWLNSLSNKGKPAALGKGVAHWSGAVAEQCNSCVNVWMFSLVKMQEGPRWFVRHTT